jgi:pyruvate kinase
MKQSEIFKRKTKIVCTIGPSTHTASMIERLAKAGMNIARFNLSHGSHDEHSQYIQLIRKISQRIGVPIGILMDLPGPKYRTGKLENGQVLLKKNATVVLTSKAIKGDATQIPVNLPYIAKDIKKGDTVLLDDGALQLKVIEKEDEAVRCRVLVGGALTEGRGIVVPGMKTSGPFVTNALKKHISFAIGQKPDYIALSFVDKPEHVEKVRAIMQKSGTQIPIIAKIERGDAVSRFDKILAVSDGIMVARGDLGVDIPLEKVPLVQKEIIHKSNKAGKPVITATQMLESMVNAARPTRAEVTDVANAIFDGTDAIMLSEETSIGKYPLQAVRMMAKIAQNVEKALPYERILVEREAWLENKTDELIGYSACHTAQRIGAAAIVAFTQSGSTAGRVSKYRPRVPILALTPNTAVSGRLLLRWGVFPLQIEGAASIDELFAIGVRLSKESGLAKSGDLIVITGGVPVGVAGSTNLLKVETIA